MSEDGRKEGRMPASKQASLSVNIVLLPLGRIFDPRNVLNRFINYCVTKSPEWTHFVLLAAVTEKILVTRKEVRKNLTHLKLRYLIIIIIIITIIIIIIIIHRF